MSLSLDIFSSSRFAATNTIPMSNRHLFFKKPAASLEPDDLSPLTGTFTLEAPGYGGRFLRYGNDLAVSREIINDIRKPKICCSNSDVGTPADNTKRDLEAALGWLNQSLANVSLLLIRSLVKAMPQEIKMVMFI